jgi:RluA family pseudouridine synthase
VGIPVVYEDEWLLVVNKPAGLLVVPTPKIEKDTLTDILKLYPCHRLDRETSGLIIYAKNKSVQRDIARQFRLRQVKKKYIVFAQGQLRQSQGQIRIPLEGLSAVTRYRVVDRRKNFTVLEVEPLTGRTNQIRIHLKAIGHPVVGEKRFAFRRDFKLKANRLCLHAKSLEFRHPLADKKIILDSHLPLGMQNFLEKNPE